MRSWNQMRKLNWGFVDETVSEEFIRKIGKELGYEFPEDYIKCAAKYNGANVEPEVFDVEGRERVFGTLLTYDKSIGEYIVNVYNDYKSTLPKGLVPIVLDPAGNLVCFDYNNNYNSPIVVFWEHENAGEKEIIMEEEGLTVDEVEKVARENVFYVADTFTDFLNKLHD